METNYQDGKEIYIDIFAEETNIVKEDMKKYPLVLWAGYRLCKSKIDIDVSKWAIYKYKEKYKFLKNGNCQKQKNINMRL